MIGYLSQNGYGTRFLYMSHILIANFNFFIYKIIISLYIYALLNVKKLKLIFIHSSNTPCPLYKMVCIIHCKTIKRHERSMPCSNHSKLIVGLTLMFRCFKNCLRSLVASSSSTGLAHTTPLQAHSSSLPRGSRLKRSNGSMR